MIKINVEEKKENVVYELNDCLFLTHKNTKKLCLAIITEHCIDRKKRYDLTMLSGDEDKDLKQWNNMSSHETIESLINSVKEFYEITKLKQNQYEIIVNIKQGMI